MEKNIIELKKIGSKGRTKISKILKENTPSKNVEVRKKILDKYSIIDQLTAIRDAVIAGDNTIIIKHQKDINEILSKY